MNTEINNNTTPATTNTAVSQQWVADEALDTQEKLTAEDINQKYHDYLSQINAEEGSGTTKDRMARLASIIASKNLMI